MKARVTLDINSCRPKASDCADIIITIISAAYDYGGLLDRVANGEDVNTIHLTKRKANGPLKTSGASSRP